jgi:hypothetical protein
MQTLAIRLNKSESVLYKLLVLSILHLQLFKIIVSWLILRENASYTAKTQYRKFETNITKKELRGHIPNFHIHVFVSDLYIPTINLPILLQANTVCGPILGINKSATDTRMWKLGLRPRNSQKRKT